MPIPYITIELDKAYKLRLSMDAVREFERETGKSLMKETEEITLSTALELLWIMLRVENPECTLEKIASLINDYADNYYDLYNAAAEVVLNSFFGERHAELNPLKPTAK